MATFVISPHCRLQEWVAEEQGYFATEGLDYEFREAIGTKGTLKPDSSNLEPLVAMLPK